MARIHVRTGRISLHIVKNNLLALFSLILGALLGLTLLEVTLRLNPTFLFRGMGARSPVDLPIEMREYDVYYSDADIFFWQSDLIRPIPPGENQLEARVRFNTDEFGFPNSAPLPEEVDVVILGRSFSLGAQASEPWPSLLAHQSDLKVLNLAQAGSDIENKSNYLQDFGLKRNPKWVIVEVLPSMDIIGYNPRSDFIVQDLPFAITQQFARWFYSKQKDNPENTYIYPLTLDLPGQEVILTFFHYYFSALTVDRRMLETSTQWHIYRQELLNLVNLAQSNGVCAILLYAPTKSEIYLPLATKLEQLEPVLFRLSSWKLDNHNTLVQANEAPLNPYDMVRNTHDLRDLISTFANQQGIPLSDPTERLAQVALEGDSPFMVYDTHWSTTGHQIVAQSILETLQTSNCP